MGRPRFTYAEALRILARGDARITKLDSALGGIILGAAPFTGGAALALLDAKSEAIKLLRELTDTAPARIKAAKGKAHYELLEAAHAVLALTAFFGAFRDTIGPRFRDLELTHDDLEALDRQPVPPMPSAIRGFSENLVEVAGYFEVLFSLTLALVEGLAAWEQVGWADRMMLRREVVGKAQHYYHDHYVRLAADLPEFAFWTWMQEHAATRSALRELHDLLASTIKATGQTGDVERKLARRAGEVLEKPLWRTDSPVSGIAFPSVAEGFVSPRFRVTVADKASRPADETWWLDQPTAQDLGSFLTVQLTHPDSARHPLIILGHPGAGKTLMAEVLAARLPAESYTPILVRLRRVDADAELHRQLETALESTVRERVSWGQLCRENKATKVLILDGFDELIQATGVAQSGYLEQIAEFQQEAWRDGHSVIAIITSRTLVMDRARVPEGCTLVKLEDFDDTQLESWLEAWNGANRAIQGFRPLTVTELLRHGDLARQPLLTVLLAIYAADTVIDGAEAKALSRCELYKRLLDSFVARQIRDKAPGELGDGERRLQETLLRRDLAVAAFAMFNRGQQFITEADLDKDLSVLSPAEPAAVRASFGQPVSRARRTVAAFFFVHVAQADEHDADRARRTFEFLHATFGEYLVAEYSVELLQEVAAELEFQRTRAFGGRPDDRAFRALLSHQPLLKRWPVVEFVRHMVMEQSALRDACLELLATSRSRGAVDGLEAYEPSPFDSVARLAAYSVNLVTLACICACGWGWPSIADLSRGADWESTVRLWRAGLDRQGQVAVMGTLIRTDDDRVELTGTGTDSIEANTARLVQDRLTDLRLRSGGLLWWSAMPPTPGQLEVHVDVVAMLADRWPVPILDHLTLPDEDRYRRLAEATRTVIMAPDTARCLLKLLIDDGPRLPREVVTPLAKAAVAAWIGDPPVLLPALIVRCPYLIDDLPWEPEGAGAPISPLSLLLLLRGLERLPRRQRPSLAGVAESAAMALIAEDFKPEQSTIEMVDWAVSAGLSGSAVSGLLRAFETYGAAVWKQISHRQMAALVRRADDVPDKLLEGYRACHSCPAGPDAKDLDAKDLSILGYR